MVMFRSGSQDESWRGLQSSMGARGRVVPSVEMSMQLSLSFPPNIEHLPVCSCFSCLPYASSIRSVQWQGLFFGRIGYWELGIGDWVLGMGDPGSCCGLSYWWVRQLKCNNRFELLIGWVWEPSKAVSRK